MSKTLIALGLAAAFSLGTTAAQAKDLTGWFVNAGVGTAHYTASLTDYGSGTESDSSFQINAGWRSQFIGVEAGYVDLGSVKYTASPVDLASNGSAYSAANYKLSGDGWTVGINGHFNPTKMWYISARGGLFLWKLHAKETLVTVGSTTADVYKGNIQSADWYAGVGTGVDFNRNMSLGVNFDFYKMAKDGLDINNKVFSVNFEYRF